MFKPFDKIEICDHIYPLTTQVLPLLNYDDVKAQYTYSVKEFGPLLVGRGDTAEMAKLRWEMKFHRMAQQAWHGKFSLPGRSTEYAVTDALFKQLIDNEKYTESTPREYITTSNIVDIDEETMIFTIRLYSEEIEIDLLWTPHPRAFAAYEVGQWFNAVVQQDRITGDVIAILWSEKIKTPSQK